MRWAEERTAIRSVAPLVDKSVIVSILEERHLEEPGGASSLDDIGYGKAIAVGTDRSQVHCPEAVSASLIAWSRYS
jgi:hypothetical protein